MKISDDPRQSASLGRRLAAIVYDSLLIIALMIVAASLVFVVRDGQAPPTNTSWYSLYLAMVPFAFFIGFWTRAGQTLGMRAWRLRLVANGNNSITVKQASIRFFAAILSWLSLGAGFVWQLIDQNELSWHDRLSGTQLVIEPAKPRVR